MKRTKRTIVLKGALYASLLLIGMALFWAGGCWCIMAHLPDIAGMSIMTAGFLLIVMFSCGVQEELQEALHRKYGGRPIYRVEKRRKKKNEEHQNLRRHGRSPRKMGQRGVA